jgi:hypothetical protein
MRRRHLFFALAIGSFLPAFASAQNLRDLLTGAGFLQPGLTLARPSGTPNPCDQVPVPATCHVAHFDSVGGQFDAINQFSTQLVNQLSAFPLPSSSGGFTYTYDRQRGTFTRGSDSFGPIYAERADTIGHGRVNLGISYSHFNYDRINDLGLANDDIRVLFLHAPSDVPSTDPADKTHLAPWFRGDVITGSLRFKVDTNIAAFVATFGVTDRFDVGLAVPVVDVSVRQESTLTIERLATGEASGIHQFAGTDPNCTLTGTSIENCRRSGSKTGIGDVVLRGKFRLTSGTGGGLALASDVRLPTGDEKNLLGTGVTQVKAFLVGSAHLGTFSPHLNAGYTWAINRTRGQPADSPGIPDEINYTGGFDWAFGPRVTFAADVIGRTFRKTLIVDVATTSFLVNPDPTCNSVACTPDPSRLVTFRRQQLVTRSGDLNTLLGSAGFKINPVGNILITVNGLFSIGKKGLQDRFTPVIGFDYAF